MLIIFIHQSISGLTLHEPNGKGIFLTTHHEPSDNAQ